jgi:hypothetical protein
VHPATLNKDIALLEVDGFNKFKLLLARDVNMAATGHDRTVLLQKGKWTTPKLWSRGSGTRSKTKFCNLRFSRNVKYGTKVYTDDAVAYEQGMQWRFVHEFVNKTETYVRGRVHVNGMENFWSLLKRGLKGTYVAVEPFHLERYIDEQVFRYHKRKHEDGTPITPAERFSLALPQFANKRLTYAELTGKTEDAALQRPEPF